MNLEQRAGLAVDLRALAEAAEGCDCSALHDPSATRAHDRSCNLLSIPVRRGAVIAMCDEIDRLRGDLGNLRTHGVDLTRRLQAERDNARGRADAAEAQRDALRSWKADALIWLRVLAHDFNMASELELALLLEDDDD